MSEDMSSTWKYLNSANSRISSLKGYIAHRESGLGIRSRLGVVAATRNGRDSPSQEERQGWRAWAGQKIGRKTACGTGNEVTEVINLFPGWAARKYGAEDGTRGPRPFELGVFISGYVISHRSRENMTRSQRAFLRLAKGFASLPKLVNDPVDPISSLTRIRLTPSTEALLAQVKLPPRPLEITDDYEVDALERQLRRAKNSGDQSDDTASSGSSSSSRSSTLDLLASNTSRPSTNPKSDIHPQEKISALSTEVIQRLHANLEKRLQPFWSSVLSNRTVRLRLFTSTHRDNKQKPFSYSGVMEDNAGELLMDEDAPLATQDVITSADGSFQFRFNINYEELCHHPKALHIAFGETVEDHDLMIMAELLPPGTASRPSISPYILLDDPLPPPPVCLTHIPITHSPIRVVSDIDDTVKFSGILSGARAVFRNVFVNDLTDNVIPGMGEWYTSMWQKGVRFHYVSNGPFEILPIVSEFFQVSRLPPGSIKLRSYAGRSLFNGLLSAPAARKRAGVVDILDSFPDTRFILIGDTGEQDLELYADLAREMPERVLAVFVRDADALTLEGPDPLDDPTGWKAIGAAGTRPAEYPLVPRNESDVKSESGSFSQYNFASPASSVDYPASYDINKTIGPNGTKTSLDGKSLARSRNQVYYGAETWSAEPEPLERSTIDPSATPTQPHTRMGHPGAGGAHKFHPQYQDSPTPTPPPMRQFFDQPYKPTPPPSITAGMNSGSVSAPTWSQQTGSSTSLSSGSTGKKPPMTENEKKKHDLQLRVWRARTQMPSHIPLRIFRDPSECLEATEILNQEW